MLRAAAAALAFALLTNLEIARADDAPDAAAARLGSALLLPSDIYRAAVQIPGLENPDLRAKSAASAFAAARQAVADGRVSDAIRHACAALAIDPDHADARRLLGYQRVGDAWAGAFAQTMLKGDSSWRPQFGWIKNSEIPKFEQGLRPARGRWMTPEEDAKLHDQIDRGWVVRTDHFIVTTNIDRAAGAELAVRLEGLYQLWRQLFGEFAVTSAELQARLDGKEPPATPARSFKVIYHRSRDEYNEALRKRQPQIEQTLGIYFDAQRESHFFAGPDQDPGTINHEAVHQLFYESSPKASKNFARTANAWAVEGVACYFESLQEKAPSVFTIGAPDAGRLQAARHRRIVDNYYVPLAELTKLGMTDLQERPDLARLYSQSAGLASFFIDGTGGKYRDAFRKLLVEIYAGRDDAGTLAKLTGQSYETLDAEYLEFMKSLPATAVIQP